jgi:Co/Zn/Cd efflux system component
MDHASQRRAVFPQGMPAFVRRPLSWVGLARSPMGIVGTIVIARRSWSLMRDAASVLLGVTDEHVADEVRELLNGLDGARITDLHI